MAKPVGPERPSARAEQRGPLVAGVEIGSRAVRVVLGQRGEGRLHVVAAGHAGLAPDAVSGGLVVDRDAVGTAVATAFGQVESRERAARVVVAVDGDDVRTYHTSLTFERESLSEPIVPGEVARAVHEAREEAAREARETAVNDPALRGVATVQMRDDPAGFRLDGRSLSSLVGFQGRFVEVRTDVSLAPLILAAAATAALESARRRATVTSGAYALGRLLAVSGMDEGGVLRLGADVTAFAIVRDGRVTATRAFGLGRDAFLARASSGKDLGSYAALWARCVLSPVGPEGEHPAAWRFVGVPEELLALPRALAAQLAERRGSAVEIVPLRLSDAGRVASRVALHTDDLVAASAAAIAAEI